MLKQIPLTRRHARTRLGKFISAVSSRISSNAGLALFSEAQAFARQLKLKNDADWRKFCKGELLHKGRQRRDIPPDPEWPTPGTCLGFAGLTAYLEATGFAGHAQKADADKAQRQEQERRTRIRSCFRPLGVICKLESNNAIWVRRKTPVGDAALARNVGYSAQGPHAVIQAESNRIVGACHIFWLLPIARKVERRSWNCERRVENSPTPIVTSAAAGQRQRSTASTEPGPVQAGAEDFGQQELIEDWLPTGM
jgi:hypothetical protein